MNHLAIATFKLYLLVMLSELCHSSIFAHSRSSFTIAHDPTSNRHALENHSKSYSTEPYNDSFSLMSLISEDGLSSLFVVCRNDTIIQLSIDDFSILNIFRKDSCLDSQTSDCGASITINLLSEIQFLNKNKMYYCYLISGSTLPNCEAPKIDATNNKVTWTKDGFASTRSTYRTFTIQTRPHIFIGSFNRNSLMILRTMMPTDLGVIDTDDTLVTPKKDFYFEKNSNFLEVFATQYEVYYVLVEPIVVERKSEIFIGAIDYRYSDTRTIIVTRLIRICRDDPGGSDPHNIHHFGTTAKSDIICSVGSESNKFDYTRVIGASWSGKYLYVLFENQKNAPSGKVLCVYDVFEFNQAFNSNILNHRTVSSEVEESPKPNPIKDVCKRLTKRSLNEKEVLEAKDLSINGLYRVKDVEPIGKEPIMNLKNLPYNSISTFRLNNVDPTIVIVLIGDNIIRLLSDTGNHSICFLEDLQLRNSEKISQVKGHNVNSNVFLHISTNERVVQLELSMCRRFAEKIDCLSRAPNICGWDSRLNKCNFLTETTDGNLWKRSKCRDVQRKDPWSLPEKCKISSEVGSSICTCTYCVNEAGCGNEGRVKINDCVDSFTVDTYGKWSPWGVCSYQRRAKECRSTKCRDIFDYRECQYSSTSARTSKWTKWHKSPNTKYHVSYRAKCPLNRLLPPIIEERKMLCGDSCKDATENFSPWSECQEAFIQYRLLNCSSFETCSHTKNEVKSCTSSLSIHGHSKGGNIGEYSTIHIVLAILIASLVWLLILVFVTIIFFRRKIIHKLTSKRRNKPGKMSSKRKLPLLDGSFYMQQKSYVSVNSNDYLSRDIQSSCYNTSFVSQSDFASHSSKSSPSIIPLIVENHEDICGD